MGRIQPGDVWSFKDWAVLFTDGEAALEEVRIAYAQAQKSVAIHSYIADAGSCGLSPISAPERRQSTATLPTLIDGSRMRSTTSAKRRRWYGVTNPRVQIQAGPGCASLRKSQRAQKPRFRSE